MKIRTLSAAGAVLTVLTSLNLTPAHAALLDFQFSFVDAETGTPVSGSFRFDDSIEPIIPSNPALGAFYLNASSSSTITVGEQEFAGGVNSLVVANDFVNAAPPDVFDLVIFDDFVGFDPSNPAGNVYTGVFLFSADAISANAPPTTVPARARLASVTVGNETYTSTDTQTAIASVPEPALSLGLLGLAVFGIRLYPKRRC